MALIRFFTLQNYHYLGADSAVRVHPNACQNKPEVSLGHECVLLAHDQGQKSNGQDWAFGKGVRKHTAASLRGCLLQAAAMQMTPDLSSQFQVTPVKPDQLYPWNSTGIPHNHSTVAQ